MQSSAKFARAFLRTEGGEPKEFGERIASADHFFRNSGANIREGGNQAFYTVNHDYIRIPRIEMFRDAESHAAAIAHDLTHWARHTLRLHRDLGPKRFADAEDHASYIGN